MLDKVCSVLAKISMFIAASCTRGLSCYHVFTDFFPYGCKLSAFLGG